MNLCDRGHDEVCYEVAKCPACELISELDEVRDDKRTLETELSDTETEVYKLKEQINVMERL